MKSKLEKDIPYVKGWVPFNVSEKRELVEKLKNTEIEKVEILRDWKDKPLIRDELSGGRFFTESNKTIKYPKVLDEYFKNTLGIINNYLKEHFIKVELDRLEGEITVRSTPKTFDPVKVLKAFQFVELMTRYVPVESASRVLEEDMTMEIYYLPSKINPEQRAKRLKRLSEDLIKNTAKEVLNCEMFPVGKTVAIICPCEYIKDAFKVVRDNFVSKTLPLVSLRKIEVKRELMKIPEYKDKDWSTIFKQLEPKKKNVQSKKPKNINIKKEYNPFPNPQQPRKEDEELEAGTYHLNHKKMKGKNYYRSVNKLKESSENVAETSLEPPKKKHKKKNKFAD